jgi:pimeloyl-ACP methyl ester carboxylesterase
MPEIERDGLSMHYEIRPGLVPENTLLIHGNLASNAWWEPAAEIWKGRSAGAGFQGALILAEWRGCGKSEGPRDEAGLGMDVLARDYVELLRRLRIARADVIGHSTGGLIALLAMAQAPELFRAAVLLDPVPPTGARLSPELLAAMAQMSRDRELCATIMGGAIRGNDPNSPLFRRIVDDAFGVHPLIWQGVPRALDGIDFRTEAAGVRRPVLVLHGEHDPILPIAESEALAKILPQGRFERLAGQGHSCNVENPARFVEAVDRFLWSRSAA